MKLIAVGSVVLPKPVVEKGKQVRVKTLQKGREIEVDAYDHEQVKPGTIIEVDDKVAKELIAAKAARKVIPGVDTDFDEADNTETFDEV